MKRYLLLVMAMMAMVCAQAQTSGKCGDKVSWRYDESSATLTVTAQYKKDQGLDPITGNPSPITHKIIKDNQLLILRGEKMYSIDGRLIQ